jgi:hypothetical protein
VTHLFASLMLALQSANVAPPPASTPPPPACASDAHAAFDFWVGEWDVFASGTDTKVATSRIERVATGCAIRETWMQLTGGGGTSITLLNHRTARWEQVWIGGDGKRVDFTGGIVEGAMVLTGYWDNVGPKGEDQVIRMTYTALADGSVRQFGEASSDHGRTWQPSFDFNYRAMKDASQ